MKSTLALTAAAALLATTALAEDTRQLDAHEHGTGALDIAIDGTTVAMELRVPGADIVGFEHAAESDEDRAAIAEALTTLSTPTDLFGLSDAAGCTVEAATADLETEGAEDHDHDHGDHTEEHGHDDHGHDDHGHEDHAEEAEGATHSEFHAEYTHDCTAPEELGTITFAYFDLFEGAQELEVQVVTGDGAQAFEVTRDAPTLDLGGLF
ncbi:zinc uptake protein ZrgA [Jannaschia marina]|uniref:zinc uptake protein ZrgA n=1 Tax=Jannaschia marina TaxID=2741674 RepID=UPI0015C6B0D9|nr:DUF2796 domain-containing protein [Jannaschia marina]